jgi:hypothetical protein
MTWIKLKDFNWEYDNNPPNPNNAETPLWTKQVNGIRTSTFDGTEIYTKCRVFGEGMETMGELNKTYLDFRGHTATISPTASSGYWVDLSWNSLTWTG